jgi:hypothetical protein
MSNRVAIPHSRAAILLTGLLVGFSSLATAEVSIGIGLPSVSIGINVPVYPTLVPVPGYPVYYDPQLRSNLFFYDGLYWVYAQDNWYTSSWYNGPWDVIEAEMVPDFVLRVPLRFYRRPPAYFRGWDRDAPPRWGEHWGHNWEERRHGWDRWDRASIPRRAPLPIYQRQYSRDHYPSGDEQRNLRDRNYRYQPREEVARRHFEQQPGREQPGREHQQQPGRERGQQPGREREPRQNAPAVERPSNGERRRAPTPPSRSTADGQHGQSDRRPPEHARPNTPPPDSRRGTPPPADHPAAPERRNTPPPRPQPDHRDSQRTNPGNPQREGRPAREPGRDTPQRSRSD